jgi:hypothetical protein
MTGTRTSAKTTLMFARRSDPNAVRYPHSRLQYFDIVLDPPPFEFSRGQANGNSIEKHQ